MVFFAALPGNGHIQIRRVGGHRIVTVAHTRRPGPTGTAVGQGRLVHIGGIFRIHRIFIHPFEILVEQAGSRIDGAVARPRRHGSEVVPPKRFGSGRVAANHTQHHGGVGGQVAVGGLVILARQNGFDRNAFTGLAQTGIDAVFGVAHQPADGCALVQAHRLQRHFGAFTSGIVVHIRLDKRLHASIDAEIAEAVCHAVFGLRIGNQDTIHQTGGGTDHRGGARFADINADGMRLLARFYHQVAPTQAIVAAAVYMDAIGGQVFVVEGHQVLGTRLQIAESPVEQGVIGRSVGGFAHVEHQAVHAIVTLRELGRQHRGVRYDRIGLGR